MHLQSFLSSLDAGLLRDHILEAVRLERRRSTTSKAVTGLALFGLGALVGGAALFALWKKSPGVAAQVAAPNVGSVTGETPATSEMRERTPDRTRDGTASA